MRTIDTFSSLGRDKGSHENERSQAQGNHVLRVDCHEEVEGIDGLF
jgi:hypothetical protein